MTKLTKISQMIAMAMAGGVPNDPNQCGTELTEAQVQYCKVRTILLIFDVKHYFQDNHENWNAPSCNAETHACKPQGGDNCFYSCIRKEDCEDKLETTPVGDGFVCNCVKHDPLRYGFVWSCDNKGVNLESSDTNHQYGSVEVKISRLP